MSCCNSIGKIALRVTRICNGAQIRRRITASLPLGNFNPAGSTPDVYISAGSRTQATVTSVNVTPTNVKRSRVSLTYSFPVIVKYLSADGTSGWASSTITDTADLLIELPECPYTITVDVAFSSRTGSITDNVATVTGCQLITVKVLTECDVTVNGACRVEYPEATLTEDVNCSELFSNG